MTDQASVPDELVEPIEQWLRANDRAIFRLELSDTPHGNHVTVLHAIDDPEWTVENGIKALLTLTADACSELDQAAVISDRSAAEALLQNLLTRQPDRLKAVFREAQHVRPMVEMRIVTRDLDGNEIPSLCSGMVGTVMGDRHWSVARRIVDEKWQRILQQHGGASR